MAALREILAHFKIDVDSRPLAAAHKQIEGFKQGVSGLTGVFEKIAGPNAFGALANIAGVWAGATVLGNLKEFVEHQIEAGKALAITSEKIGVNIDKLQEWHLAAEEAGVGVDDLDKAFKFLNRNLGAEGKGKKEIQQAFADLGGKGTGSEDVSMFMLKLSDRFAGLDTQAKRTALAISIFGKSGQNVLPLLQQGSAAVKEMMDDVKELGESQGDAEAFAKGAKETAKQLARWQFASHGLQEQFVRKLLPVMTNIVKLMAKAAAEFRKFAKDTDIVAESLKVVGFGAAFLSLKKIFDLLGVNTSTIKGFASSLLKMGPGALLFVAMALAIEDIFGLLTGKDSVIGQFIDRLYGAGTAAKGVEELKEAWKALFYVIGGSLPSTNSMIKAMVLSLREAAETAFFLGKSVLDLGMVLGKIGTGQFKGGWEAIKTTFEDLRKVGGHLDKIVTAPVAELTDDKSEPGIIRTPDRYKKAHGAFGPELPPGWVPPGQAGPQPPPGWVPPAPVVNIENNFNGPADMNKVKTAVKEGVDQAVSGANRRRAHDAVKTGY